MAKVSITEAIKLSGISRSSFYGKYIKQGVISLSAGTDGRKEVDTSELLRVFGELQESPKVSKVVQMDSPKVSKENTFGQSENTEISLLKQQLQESEQREKAAVTQIEDLQKDKAWYQSQITGLTNSIKLLEGPKHPRLWWQIWK